MADGILKVGTITNSAGSGNIAIGSGVTLLSNVPAFEAYLSADQTVTDGAFVKAQPNTEVFDTDNCYDNSTNYRFTPTVAGKYYVYAVVTNGASVASTITQCFSNIYKNGSEIARNNIQFGSNPVTEASIDIFTIIDMNGTTDYVELYGLCDVSSGTSRFESLNRGTRFGAYRIGA